MRGYILLDIGACEDRNVGRGNARCDHRSVSYNRPRRLEAKEPDSLIQLPPDEHKDVYSSGLLLMLDMPVLKIIWELHRAS